MPDQAEIHNNIGTVLLELGQRAEAIDHYRRAANCAPALADIWYNLANAPAAADASTEAETCFQRALALRPAFAAAYANYGRLLMERQRWAEAEPVLSRALQLAPGQAAVWNNLGILWQDRDLAEAEACFRTAISLDPASAQAHYNLGCVLSAQGRTDDALAAVARSLDEYVAIAVRLARDTGWREAVRRDVARGKTRAYQNSAYVRALEDFLASALADRRAGGLGRTAGCAPSATGRSAAVLPVA